MFCKTTRLAIGACQELQQCSKRYLEVGTGSQSRAFACKYYFATQIWLPMPASLCCHCLQLYGAFEQDGRIHQWVRCDRNNTSLDLVPSQQGLLYIDSSDTSSNSSSSGSSSSSEDEADRSLSASGRQFQSIKQRQRRQRKERKQGRMNQRKYGQIAAQRVRDAAFKRIPGVLDKCLAPWLLNVQIQQLEEGLPAELRAERQRVQGLEKSHALLMALEQLQNAGATSTPDVAWLPQELQEQLRLGIGMAKESIQSQRGCPLVMRLRDPLEGTLGQFPKLWPTGPVPLIIASSLEDFAVRNGLEGVLRVAGEADKMVRQQRLRQQQQGWFQRGRHGVALEESQRHQKEEGLEEEMIQYR